MDNVIKKTLRLTQKMFLGLIVAISLTLTCSNVWAGSNNTFSPFILKAGQTINVGSLNLAMQTDGNLVLYQNGTTPLWATSYFSAYNLPGFSGPSSGMQCLSCYADFQSDGNLVLYNPNFNGSPSHAYWASGTSGNPGARLQITPTAPYISILSSSNAVLWASISTYSGFILNAGKSITIGVLNLTMQTDGNLVLYQNGIPLWATSYFTGYDYGGAPPTSGMQCSNCTAAFQSDGNLVLYNPNFNGDPFHAYWASGTSGNPGANLQISSSAPYISILNGAHSVIWGSLSMDRIGTIAAGGVAEFYDKSTGLLFPARGASYTRLSNSTGNHITFDPGSYNIPEAESALAAMQSSGYNYVRIFLTSTYVQNGFGMSTPGINSVWLSNVNDFMTRASNHKLRVVLSGFYTPANYLNSLASSCSTQPYLTGSVNPQILCPGYATATAKFWTDFLSGLETMSPAILSIILYIDVDTEIDVDLSSEPFSLTSGEVNFGGIWYNMAVPADRQQLIDASSVQWIDTIRASILAVDPQILVGISVFTPLAVGHAGFDGATIPAAGQDTRYPLRPLIFMLYSNADIIDVHVYPTGIGFNEAMDLGSAEITAGMNLTKPLIMGEYGANQTAYPTIASAAAVLQSLLANSCVYGFSGWSIWTWNTDEQVDPTWWDADTDNGAMNGVVAPVVWPNICPITSSTQNLQLVASRT